MAKWVAIVNRIEARIFDAENMRKIYVLTNNLGREKNRAFTTSRPDLGRNRTASKASTHNMTGEKNPHDDAAIQFARKVNLYLGRRFNEHKFESLVVAAEPRMMGWIKVGMDKHLEDRCEWKRKDLGKKSDHALKILFLGKEAVWPKTESQRSSS
jgi:protein required for attachment to host cells